MKFVGFEYRNLNNLGDHIQSIAAEQHIPAVVSRVNRDSMANIQLSEKQAIVMNGWFTHQT